MWYLQFFYATFSRGFLQLEVLQVYSDALSIWWKLMLSRKAAKLKTKNEESLKIKVLDRIEGPVVSLVALLLTAFTENFFGLNWNLLLQKV